jgi:hypothetical protein
LPKFGQEYRRNTHPLTRIVCARSRMPEYLKNRKKKVKG